MALTISGIQPFWSGNATLTALIPATNVWLAPVADGIAMPYVAFEQIKADTEYVFGGATIEKTRYKLTVWATTLATVDTITTAVIAQFNIGPITAIAIGNYLKNVVPAQATQGAYSGSTEWLLLEKNQPPS